MQKFLIVHLLLFLLFVPATVTDYNCLFPNVVARSFKGNDFMGGGFIMSGTALAASRTVDKDDPKVLALQKELLNNQKAAPLFKKVEREMTVEKTYKATFGIDVTKRRLAEIINDWIKTYGNFSTSIIYKYSEVMEAKLTGEGFDIVPQSEPVQKFPEDKKISWDFLVTPKKPGLLKLHLEIYAIETSKSVVGAKVRTHRHEEDIYVSSTVHSVVKETVGPESTVGMLIPLKEIAGAIFVVAMIIWGWLTKRGHRRIK